MLWDGFIALTDDCNTCSDMDALREEIDSLSKSVVQNEDAVATLKQSLLLMQEKNTALEDEAQKVRTSHAEAETKFKQ
jgi:regulator of replication initiation timing